jgi:hypothetical protein
LASASFSAFAAAASSAHSAFAAAAPSAAHSAAAAAHSAAYAAAAAAAAFANFSLVFIIFDPDSHSLLGRARGFGYI